jgi:hypothetical protein
MYSSITARIAAAIAAACTTTLLFAIVVSLSEPAAVTAAPQLAMATVSTTAK